MSFLVKSIPIHREKDTGLVRCLAWNIAAGLGVAVPDQMCIAMAASEIACNALSHAGGGNAEFTVDRAAGVYTVCIRDDGPGIRHLGSILNGEYRHGGLGLGIAGARSLANDFAIQSQPGGTQVELSMRLPESARNLTLESLEEMASELPDFTDDGPMAEVHRDNRHLMAVIAELRALEENLGRLNGELEDTNRGVVALYAELEDKADRLRRSDQMKSRFLSQMSHEFRTPLSSIMALSRLLLDESDGKLSAEQQKQATFIRKSAEGLLDLVNDLLDLSRVEAGKSVVRPAHFKIAKLFAALRGVLRPLQVNEAVELAFHDPAGLPAMYTDEAKVTQILRNFISNALKFTERGTVTVSARLSDNGEHILFSVADTGIGIRAEDQGRIFQEFGQLDTPVQSRVRGTGLGLSLSKGLAELLGGRAFVESQYGCGSTFFAEIPLVYTGSEAERPALQQYDVLIIDSEEIFRYVARQALSSSATIAEAADGMSGIELAGRLQPRVVLLDSHLQDMSGQEVVRQLKGRADTRNIPVVLLTAATEKGQQPGGVAGAAEVLPKDILSQTDGAQRLRSAIDSASQSRRAARGAPASEAYR